MDLNFEYRKRRYLESIVDEYAPQKRKNRWQPNPLEYILTEEYAEQNSRSFYVGDKVIVYNSIKLPIIICVFFLIILTFVYFTTDDRRWFYILAGSGFVLGIILLPNALKSKERLRVTKDEFWYYKKFANIEWQYVLSSYIKITIDDDTKYHYLVIHYYDETKDEFQHLEINIDELDISPDEIAFIVEKFKKGK